MVKSYCEKHMDRLKQAEDRLYSHWQRIDARVLENQSKVLEAFHGERVGAHHFQSTTGYGYNDLGRETLERLFARIFKGEAALVRQQFASGTHAITCCLRGLTRPGDEILFATGEPYDTLQAVLGLNNLPPVGNLKEYGVTTKVIPLTSEDRIDIQAVRAGIHERTRIIAFQRSRGYSLHRSISITDLSIAFNALREALPPRALFFVDNCYGEFVELQEPLEVGAHLIAGSLIKNPGGGLAPSGGYVVGQGPLVELVAADLFAPGIGMEVGASLHNLRPFYQGLFEAPSRVGEMLKSASLWAEILSSFGFAVSPHAMEERTDVIQSVEFHDASRLQEFFNGIQGASPVDGHAMPVAAAMPGYDHPVIMAAGTFISGSTSEMSADAPFIPPFRAYIQGGLSMAQTRLAILYWLATMKEEIS